jgi:hypothetical protein
MIDIGHTEVLLIDVWMSGGCFLNQLAKDMQHHASCGTCGTRYVPRERKGEEPSVVHRTRTTMLWMSRPNNRELHDIHKAIEGRASRPAVSPFLHQPNAFFLRDLAWL